GSACEILVSNDQWLKTRLLEVSLPGLVLPGGQLDHAIDGQEVEGGIGRRTLRRISAPPDPGLHGKIVGDSLTDLIPAGQPDVAQIGEGGREDVRGAGVRKVKERGKPREEVPEIIPHHLGAEDSIRCRPFLEDAPEVAREVRGAPAPPPVW